MFTPATPGAVPFRRDFQLAASQTPGTRKIENRQAILITATALTLGSIANLGWAWFKNRDATNPVSIRNGAAGADLLTLKAGEEFWVRLKSNAVPYGIASGGTVELEYCIMEL